MTDKQIENGRSRAMIYSMLAQSLWWPTEPLCIAIEDGTFHRFLRSALADAPKRHRRTMVPEVDKFTLLPDAQPFFASLTIEYTKLFSLDLNCPHYEADYLAPDPNNSVHMIAAVANVYSIFGMHLAENTRERPDHIAVELDFMNFLSSKEVYARENCQEENVKLCRQAQAFFLKAHLLCWGNRFTQILRSATSFWFYQGIAGLLASFLEAEAKYLRVQTPAPLLSARSSVPMPNNGLVTITGLRQTHS